MRRVAICWYVINFGSNLVITVLSKGTLQAKQHDCHKIILQCGKLTNIVMKEYNIEFTS